MSEVKAITNTAAVNLNLTQSGKTQMKDGQSFASYLEGKKDLDQIFREASKKYNVPVELLKAIGKAESDFVVDAVSRSGAQGIMQLMPKTAEYLGVKDPFDPEQNINGGAKYIKELLDKYDGDTKLALAAYNAGMNNVKKYGGIPPFEETQKYVVKVMNYMQQNLEAGSVSVNTAAQNRIGLQAAPSAPLQNWIVPPSEQTKKNTEVRDLLELLFSYEDYLKFLEIFFREEDER
jgi:hypothetical protein